VLALFAAEGLWCDVASGGELQLALAAGFAPERIILHGNAKSRAELARALELGLGLIVIDNFDEIARLGELLRERDQPRDQQVLIRATPNVAGRTHEKISTGQADSKFGFGLAAVPEAIAAVRATPGLELRGLHAHIGSQILSLEPFAAIAQALAPFAPFPVWDLGGGLGVAYSSKQHPPAIDAYLRTVAASAREQLGDHELLLVEPGRSLVANGCLTLYTIESVKRNVSLYVAVDGGMSDNLRPMLYGAHYEAALVERPGGDRQCECVIAGKHCESGDIIVPSARLAQPAAGELLCTPATGAYTFAMANNYNGALRPPVIFCADGSARVVCRRESEADLLARDEL
jgi:diaminopimelate decarboxylase